MNIHCVTDQFGFSAQVEVADVLAIAAAGYRSLVCNRPYGEGPEQQTVQEIEVEARKPHGFLAYFLSNPVGRQRLGLDEFAGL